MIVVVHLWQIPIKDYIYNLITQQQKHSVGIVVYIVTILLYPRFLVQSPDNVFLKTIINIIIIQMIMSSAHARFLLIPSRFCSESARIPLGICSESARNW